MKIQHAEGKAYTVLILNSLMQKSDSTHQMCVVNRKKIHEASRCLWHKERNMYM